MSFTPGAGTRFLLSTDSSGTISPSGPLSITGGTATTNTPVLSATQTWNNAAVTFTGWQLNVTDTASGAASLLMDLQRGGASQFAVSKSGTVSGGSAQFAASFSVTNSFTVALWNNAALGWSASGAVGVTTTNLDLILRRDAANILAQRNDVNAQTFRLYNTFTDASNYERGVMQWSGNTLAIGTQNAGTGLGRAVQFVMGGTSVFYISPGGSLLWNSDNSFDIGASGGNRPRNLILGSYQEMSEMTAPAAPAANSVRIYAEDNGSGKTRLMALFATGAAQQIAIEP